MMIETYGLGIFTIYYYLLLAPDGSGFLMLLSSFH